MTAKISPHKVSRILRYYFIGDNQKDIALKAHVNQSTVSLYSHLFSDEAKKCGLEAAGRSFDVYEKVMALRSLAVELHKARITVDDARQGSKIMGKFLAHGINPDKHQNLVQLCKEIGNPDFVRSALRFMEIEHGCGLSYTGIVRKFEETAQKLPAAEAKILRLENEIRTLNEKITIRNRELSAIDSRLADSRKEVELEITKMKNEIDDKRTASKTSLKELEEVRYLKNWLYEKSLDIDTLVKIAKEFGK